MDFHLIEELIKELTLEEKVGMIHGAGLFRTEGVERLGIPPLFMSDGPMGVRAEFADNEWQNTGTTDDFVSYLPCNSAIASTWNPKVAELAVPIIIGIQRYDVAACVKHFAANSQETERLWVDTIVDERALEEIYFPGFRAAVEKGEVLSVMGAYNLLNGEHCCTSKSLLNHVLREKWGFDGTIISDWGGVHDTKLAAESALDIEMDVTYDFDKHHMAQPLIEKIRSGEISEEAINEKVRNNLRMMLRMHMIGEDKKCRKKGAYNTAKVCR